MKDEASPKAKRRAEDKSLPASGRLRRVAIVGLPNTGKSQLFNDITGDYTLVSNYPLTTLEIYRKRISIHGQKYEIIDTPGMHSLYIHSEEEITVREFLFNEPIDVLIQCIDANRLKQSLLFTLDLLELDIPLIISLNAVDETEQQGIKISTRKLSEILGVNVIEHIAQINKGTEEVKAAVAKAATTNRKPGYGPDLERKIGEIEALLPKDTPFRRKTAFLLLDGDPLIQEWLKDTRGDGFYRELAEKLRPIKKESLGRPSRELAKRRTDQINRIVAEATDKTFRKPTPFAQTFARLCRHPIFGVPILAGVVLATYFLVVEVAGLIEALLSAVLVDPLVRLISSNVAPGFWNDLLIGPYGLLTLGLFNAFVTVLPILSVFFLMMGFLEDTGYLPNLMVLTRKVLSKIGLSGNSIMSLILGFGCKTMATLTTKGIASRKERLIAVFLIAFAIPCSAQLAIDMAVLGRVGFKAFLIAYGTLIVVEFAAGLILNKTMKDDGQSFFLQELPPIRLPNLRGIMKKTAYRIYWFLKEAVPIFLIAAAALFIVDKIGLLDLLKRALRPIVVTWLGQPLDIVEVLILSLARHEAAAGLLLGMVDRGALTYIQTITAVVITTMFVPCFANIVAMCRQLGIKTGLIITAAINISSFILAGFLNWTLVFLRIGVG
ncbi:MAG: ferrous iron transport protein B [Spirochaetaceae bacterium]|nr:MAG: ferrous iron transport protein B [Spirochaetaceae bacterium]